jgi:hypothetical protein
MSRNRITVSEWSDMSTRVLLFLWANSIKLQRNVSFGRLTVVQHIVYGTEEKLCHSYVSKGSSSMQRIEQTDMLWY